MHGNINIRNGNIRPMTYDAKPESTCADNHEVVQDIEDLMSVCSWETDRNLQIIHVGRSCASVFGDPVSALIGRKITELTNQNALEGRNTDLQTIIGSRYTFRSYTTEVMTYSGRTAIVTLSGRPKFHEREGYFTGYRGFAKTVERRSVSATGEKNSGDARLGQLLQSLNQIANHELRTPLNAVIGFAQCLEGEIHGPIGDRQYLEYTSHIIDGANALENAVKRLLAYTESSTGYRKAERVIKPEAMMREILQETGCDRGNPMVVGMPNDAALVSIDVGTVKSAIQEMLLLSGAAGISSCETARCHDGTVRVDIELLKPEKNTDAGTGERVPCRVDQQINSAHIAEEARFGLYLATAMLECIDCSLTVEDGEENLRKFTIWISKEKVIQAF